MKVEKLLKKFDISLAGYKNFIASRMNQFKLVKSSRDEFLDTNGLFKEEQAFFAAAYLVLQAVIHARDILNRDGVWELILPKDQDYVRASVYLGATFLAKNNTIYERITGASINTPNWNAQIDTSRNIIDSDVLGTYAKTALNLAEIHKYKPLQEDTARAYVQNSFGELIVLGKIDDSKFLGAIHE